MVVIAEREEQLAPDLDEYRGQWVAIKDSRVVAAGVTPAEVLAKVSDLALGRVALHKVPENADSAYIL